MRRRIFRAYKTELDPNLAERLKFIRHAGAARFAYNWGLEKLRKAYLAGLKPPSAFDLMYELNRIKSTEFPWLYDVSSFAPIGALCDLERAYKNFLRDKDKLAKRANGRKKARADGMPMGFPRFKAKKRVAGSFYTAGAIRVLRNSIQLPRIGRVRLKERSYLPTKDVHILSATTSERAGRWFVSLLVRQEIEVPDNRGPIAGIDLGISRLITVSDGSSVDNPRALPRHRRRLRRLQRAASRKRLGGKNQAKVNRRIARCHLRISNVRKDHIHKATTWLARTKSVIGVESLNVEGMMQNHSLAGSIGDAGWGLCLRQLEYKTEWRGSLLIKAKPSFPSTRRCSRCGWPNFGLSLDQRIFRCERCSLAMDRDLNAAKNLELVALSCRETVNARQSREVTATGALALGAVPGGEAGTDICRPAFSHRHDPDNG